MHNDFLLYISSRCLRHREEAFDMFKVIDVVTAAGACHGFKGSYKSLVEDGGRQGMKAWRGSSQLYSGFKFALVMENSNNTGYVTEKLLNAFLGGSLPIYYGPEDVFKIFNKDAFIYFDVTKPSNALEHVRFLHRDRVAYEHVLQQPVFNVDAYEEYFALDYAKHGKLAKRLRNFMDINS